ncbi:MAG: hypothetical protein DKT66_02555 [Candidatus Melainabacteria bacterium]|nr:MAG: hypothetical protein DKT66_02555 [Candidatus Melainabacteria bacterium]
MAVWVIKGGEFGEREQRMLDNNLIACSWNKLPDISDCRTRDEITKAYRDAYPNAEGRTITSHVAQLNAFRHTAVPDDLVVLPLKKKGLAIGVITGDYTYSTNLGNDFNHTRSVNWLHKNVSRDIFDQDILYSFGSFLGFCQVRRNDAERRIRKIVEALTAD